jgi:hypothetical protein
MRSLDERLGPFAQDIQWVGPTLAHLNRHVAAGTIRVLENAPVRTWEVA